MASFEVFDQIIELLIATALVVGLLLLFRRVALWYWKLDRIEKHLAEIAAAMKGDATTFSPRARSKSG